MSSERADLKTQNIAAFKSVSKRTESYISPSCHRASQGISVSGLTKTPSLRGILVLMGMAC